MKDKHNFISIPLKYDQYEQYEQYEEQKISEWKQKVCLAGLGVVNYAV